MPAPGDGVDPFRPDSLLDSRSRSCAALRLLAYASVSSKDFASPLKMRYARSFTKVRNSSRTLSSSVVDAAPSAGGLVGLSPPGDEGPGAPFFRMILGPNTRTRKSSETPPWVPSTSGPEAPPVALATTPTRCFRVSDLSAGNRSSSRRRTYRRERYSCIFTAAIIASKSFPMHKTSSNSASSLSTTELRHPAVIPLSLASLALALAPFSSTYDSAWAILDGRWTIWPL